MSRFLFILVFLFIGFTAMAQRLLLNNLTTFDDKKLHFGFTLGINMVDLSFVHYNQIMDNPKYSYETIPDVKFSPTDSIRADISKLKTGFTVGIVTNLRLSESFDLRFLPGISFCERRLVYNIPVFLRSNDASSATISDSYSIKSTFLDFPLLIKYKAKRMNNQRPYLIAGGAYRIDISKTGKKDLVRLKPFSKSLEAGVGWDTYLQFFRLSTELKFSFGLDNVLDTPPAGDQYKVYSSAFSRLSTNMFILSFHFE